MTTTESISTTEPDRGGAAPRTSAQTKARWRRIRIRLYQVALFVVVLGSWELSGRLGWVDPAFCSEPSRVAKALRQGIADGDLLNLLGTTLYEMIVGYLLAVVVGFLIGVAMAEFDTFDRVIQPFLTAVNNVPRIALAPLFVIWFGLGSESRIVLTFSLVLFVIIYNTRAGLGALRREHILLARSLGFGVRDRYLKFQLPTALPSIFAGLQLGLALAFIGAIVGEMMTGNAGIGGYMQYQVNTFGTDQFFAAMVLLVVVSLVISALMRLAERLLLRWRETELR